MKTQICKWICRLRLFVMSEMVMPKSGRHKAENTKQETQSGRQKAQDFTVRGELRNESEQSAYL